VISPATTTILVSAGRAHHWGQRLSGGVWKSCQATPYPLFYLSHSDRQRTAS